MGQTRVDLLHLLEDLRDAYAGSLEETILTEMVANSLDSGASRIAIAIRPGDATLVVADDGCGMLRRELARFHDIAASRKTRGEGIGFAGVGIKLSLLLCREVLTETRRGKSHVASCWHLASRHRAPWNWIPPPGSVGPRGTAVHLVLQNPLSPLLDAGYIEAALYRHFRSLLDPAFGAHLSPYYPKGVRLEINGQVLEPVPTGAPERAPLEVRLARKRKPSAVGYLALSTSPLPEEQRGLTICTLGKGIKTGWDWLGLSPAAADRIGGCIEVPALAACLTLNKADFIRSGPRGATYLAYRKAIQEVVARQLAAWGDDHVTADAARRRLARPLERDLERVLLDLSTDFPLLGTLVEHRKSAQKSLPLGSAGAADSIASLVLRPAGGSEGESPGIGAVEEKHLAPGEAGGGSIGAEARPDAPPGAAVAEPPLQENGHGSESAAQAVVGEPGRGPAARAPRYGLSIQFDQRPGDPELGRLVESTVWINESHPACLRARASRSEGYHAALSVALALAPLTVEPRAEHDFVVTFLAKWGEALGKAKGKGGRAR